MNKVLSRRSFLRNSSEVLHKSCIVLTTPMILSACKEASKGYSDSPNFKILSSNEGTEYAAIASRIIPSDESPGANEAGVVFFMDNVLSDGRELEHNILKEGLKNLRAMGVENFGVSGFYSLNTDQQDQLLEEIEGAEFFETMRYLTIAGMLSLPEYQGNRDNIGFKMLGYENRHAWASPYGYYDTGYPLLGDK